MEAMHILAKIAKEDFSGVLREYFDPILKLWSWLKRLLPRNSERREFDEHFGMVMREIGSLSTKLEALRPFVQSRDPISAHELDLRLGEVDKRIDLVRSMFESQVSREGEILAFLKFKESNAGLVNLGAIEWPEGSWALCVDRFSGSKRLLSHAFDTDALRAVTSADGALMLVGKRGRGELRLSVAGFLGSGKSSLLRAINGSTNLGGSKRSVAYLIGDPVGDPLCNVDPIAGKLEIYVEVAGFLSQQGYHEAAAAVMARVFYLSRSIESLLAGKR